MKRLWTSTNGCHAGGPHCANCSARTPHGELHRVGWRTVYAGVPEPGECPKGVPADWTWISSRPLPTARRISLTVVMPSEVVDARRGICDACEHKSGLTCTLVKSARPTKAAAIEVGLKMPAAHCPANKWDRWPAFNPAKTP